MGKRKKRKSNVGTIIMIIVILLLSLFVYLLTTKKIDFNNKFISVLLIEKEFTRTNILINFQIYCFEGKYP